MANRITDKDIEKSFNIVDNTNKVISISTLKPDKYIRFTLINLLRKRSNNE